LAQRSGSTRGSEGARECIGSNARSETGTVFSRMAPSFKQADLFQAERFLRERERCLMAVKATIIVGLSYDRIRSGAYLSV
jgi:hypothetical protein